MERQYWMAHDCPNCGEKDERGQWKGARMGSTAWNHSWACCSDKCGIEWGKKLQTMTNKQKRKKWEELASQSDALLSGVPYPGYPWI